MQDNISLDWLLAGIALSILVGGLWMLVSGVQELNRKP